MTDQLTGVGSADAGNPASGNGDGGKGSDPAAAATANAGPAEPGNLDWAKGKGWADDTGAYNTDALIDGYKNLEKKLGSMISIPGEGAKPEDIQRFNKALGVPEKPDGYQFKRPENLPADLPYDEGMANRFKTWAHEAGIPPSRAQVLHDKYVGQFADDLQAALAEQGQKAKATHETLVKDWGHPDSEDYAKNKDAAIRALRSDQFKGLEDELKMAGLLTKEGFYVSPHIAKLLAAVGKQAQNDTFEGLNGQPITNNPFAKDTYNLTEASIIANKDPVKAREFAALAGWTAEEIKSLGL